jgi:hypothetical protein
MRATWRAAMSEASSGVGWMMISTDY